MGDLIQVKWQLNQNHNVITRLQELLKQANENYNSLVTASNTELSDHRASYRALTEETEKLREERDTLLNIYKCILNEEKPSESITAQSAEIKKMVEVIQKRLTAVETNNPIEVGDRVRQSGNDHLHSVIFSTTNNVVMSSVVIGMYNRLHAGMEIIALGFFANFVMIVVRIF